jgi:hypothetical protein
MNLSKKKLKQIRHYCQIDFIVNSKNSTKKGFLEIRLNRLEINQWKEVLLIIIRSVQVRKETRIAMLKRPFIQKKKINPK